MLHATEGSAEKASQDALVIADKIKLQLNKTYQLDNGEHYYSPSIGIATFPENGCFAEQVLQHADKAMYLSKKEGGNAISIFKSEDELNIKNADLHILLIEDSITDTYLTVETLKEFSEDNGISLEIKTLSDGEQGLDYINFKKEFSTREKNQPDLILLDLNLPKIDGFQFLKEAKSHTSTQEIPVIVFTVTTEYTIIDKCLELQADDFIQKPMTINAIKQSINNLGY